MDLRQTIKKYLSEHELMQLATSKDGQPWICTVNFVPDDDLNLYWMSARDTRHSSELRENSKTAVGVMIDPVAKICIHMEGDAYELSGDDTKKTHTLYSSRYGDKPERLEETLSDKPGDRAYYVFKPRNIVVFDASKDDIGEARLEYKIQ